MNYDGIYKPAEFELWELPSSYAGGNAYLVVFYHKNIYFENMKPYKIVFGFSTK